MLACASERVVHARDDSGDIRADAIVLAWIVPAAVIDQGAAGATADGASLQGTDA